MVRRLDDRVGDAGESLVAETRSCEQLLRALLSARHDRVGLRAGPLERLLELGPGGVRELRRLVTRLLEEPRPASLGFAQLLRRLAVRIGEELAGVVTRRVDDLCALALALLPEPLDLALPLPEVGLPAPHLLLGAPQLRRGRALRVALEHVGEFAASRIRCSASMRTAWPVGSTCAPWPAA